MYRTDGRPRDLDIDPEEIARTQARQRRTRLAVLGVVAVVLAAAGGATALVVQRRARAATQAAFDAVAGCIVGDALAPNERASSRVRNAQLVAMAVPQEKREAPGAEPWPARCAPRAHQMAEAMRAGGGGAALEESSEKLAKALGAAGSAAADLGPLVDKMFADAAAEGLKPSRARPDAVPPPPAPAAPLTLATLPQTARMFGAPLTLSAIHPAPFGDATLRFVVDDKDFAKGPHVCSLAAAAKEIVCKKVAEPAARLSPALRLWGTTMEGAAPLLFAGDRGKSGIFRSDTGALVTDKLEYGAYGANAFADGSIAYLGWREPPPETRVVRIAKDGGKKETTLVARKESGNPYYATAIFWDVAAFKAVPKGANGIRLELRTLLPAGELGPVVDVGRIDEVGHIEGGQTEEPHLTACRTADTTVVRAKGWDNTFLSFLVAGKWTAPVESSGVGGKLQCRSGEAVVSRVWGGPVNGRFRGGVTESRCTVSGCTERILDVKKAFADNVDILPREASDMRAVDVDGKLLVVWSAGDRGGLRTRIGPLDQIATAPETILVDDHIHGGAYKDESSIIGIELLPVPGGALLLVGALDGVYAWRIDGSGKAEPIPTRT